MKVMKILPASSSLTSDPYLLAGEVLWQCAELALVTAWITQSNTSLENRDNDNFTINIEATASTDASANTVHNAATKYKVIANATLFTLIVRVTLMLALKFLHK